MSSVHPVFEDILLALSPPVGRLAASELPEDQEPTATEYLLDARFSAERAKHYAERAVKFATAEVVPESARDWAYRCGVLQARIDMMKSAALDAMGHANAAYAAICNALDKLPDGM